MIRPIVSGHQLERNERVVLPFRGLGTVFRSANNDESYRTNGSSTIHMDTGEWRRVFYGLTRATEIVYRVTDFDRPKGDAT